jgi:hypothetical protein
MTSAADSVLASIDGALTACGYVGSGDAGSQMRWRPEPPEEPEREPTGEAGEAGEDDDWAPLRPSLTVTAHFRVPGRGWDACVRAGARSAGQMPGLARDLKAAYARQPGWYPRPASHCGECNPRGNPEPLAVDGREYQRRIRNRRRRR